MFKSLSYRLSLIFKSHFRKAKTDPLKEFEDYILQLERQLNNVSVSLAEFKARESVIRSQIRSEQIKIDKVTDRLKNCSDDQTMEHKQLIGLKGEYEAEIQELEYKLEQAEKSRARTQQMHKELHTAIRKVMDQGEDLKARYHHAEARQSLYGDSSGVTNKDGISRMDHLLGKVKHMEAEAESFFELSPVEMRIDAETSRANKSAK